MYKIDRTNNEIIKIEQRTFHDLKFKEREHLQEWIAKCPECLCEDLLIIQKEFDGFKDTNERLDLLAIDKNGSLVIIENKLDDTGRDVTWQALKYVSYCSTLNKQQITEIYQQYLDKNNNKSKAIENLEDFFDIPYEEINLNVDDQRMILVAGNFRKEVTSTVMWMLNHGINIQCFKASPYEYKGEVLLDVEQIIPVKESEDYIIKMADKVREQKEVKSNSKESENIRFQFWSELLEEFDKGNSLYRNVNPTKKHWLSAGSGVSGIQFLFVVTKSYVSVEVYIKCGDSKTNKMIYDGLYQQKDKIEEVFGEKLLWERLDEKICSRISYRLENVNIANTDDWKKIKEFLCAYMSRLEKSIKKEINLVAKNI